MSGIATMEVNILASDETPVTTTLFQLQQWKHALRLELKGMKLSGGKQVSTHLRQVLKVPRNYPKEHLLSHIEGSIDSIHEQLGVNA